MVMMMMMMMIILCCTWYLLPPANSPVCLLQVNVMFGEPWARHNNFPVSRLPAADFLSRGDSSMMGLSVRS